MMHVSRLLFQLEKHGIRFFAGVPDSQLKPFIHCLIRTYGISNNHMIAANEGNAVALAAGYHLATGKVPCVYMQNSGIGNMLNPAVSLLSEKVYGIPCVYVVGWRGAPDMTDEPQHRFQGEITLPLLEVLNVQYWILDTDTAEHQLDNRMEAFSSLLDAGKSIALVVKKDSLHDDEEIVNKNDYSLIREEIIQHIVGAAREDVLVSTTGKTSRELFEVREHNGQSHQCDFLTVGSMGHSSSIALGIAGHQPQRRVWCIDGDGALLMHMGSMAVIGAQSPSNLVHVVINNSAHESVGGAPTVADTIQMEQIAWGCGYREVYSVKTMGELDDVLSRIEGKKGPIFIEAKAAVGSRSDLGRPTKLPMENKRLFMEYLKT